MEPLLVTFAGGPTGAWRVERLDPVVGDSVLPVERVAVQEGRGAAAAPAGAVWALRGTTSNERYVERPEQDALAERQPLLGRQEATRAALIPVSKSAAWWELAQDERREILESRSHHITIGVEYLPAVARRLLHGRDLDEPFDFLSWFEYGPGGAGAFEELVGRLRETEEWRYVTREVDIRLARD